MTRGAYISGLGHGGLILWALFGGFFLSARDPLPVQASDVSLISSEEFAALTLPNEAPVVPFDTPVPVEPAAQEDAPEIQPVVDETPEPPKPEEVVPPETETTPLVPELSPEAEVTDQPPVIAPPPAPETPPDITNTEDEPKPAPAPRVAPEAAAKPEPDVEVADTAAPEVAPDEAAETVAEETPATAPQEAATEIVTEAETPSAAPAVSARPTARPTRPVQVAEPDEEPPHDPVEDAVAEAVTSTTPAPVQPTGPPLTGSEKAGFRVAVGKCWNVDNGSAAARVTVTIGFSLDRAGKVVQGSLDLITTSEGDGIAKKAAFEAARRAIIRCGAKGFDLPLEKFSQWQDIEMTFNPEGMRIR